MIKRVVIIRLADQAQQDLRMLDLKVARRIISKLKVFETMPSPLRFATRLTGKFDAYYRFRIGDYRAIFRQEIDQSITLLLIVRIKHRKEVYD